MKILAAIGLAVLGAGVYGQTPSLFDTVRPDLTVSVRRHSLGADLVQVSPTSPTYDPRRLRQELEKLGQVLGTPTRGVQISAREINPGNPRLRIVTASGAVDGLTNTAGGVNFAALLEAFGTGENVGGLTLILEGFAVGQETVKTYVGKGFALEGRVYQNPASVEYRIQVRSKDPKDYSMAPEAPKPKQDEPSAGPPIAALVGLLALIGVGAGALVYSLVLRRAPSR